MSCLTFQATTIAATIAATDVAGPLDGAWDIRLIPAAAAVGLLAQTSHATPAQVIGLA